MDESAVNYDANGMLRRLYLFGIFMQAIGDDAWLRCLQAFILRNKTVIFGADTTTDIVFHTGATVFDTVSGVTYGIASFEFTTWSGLPEGIAIDVPAAPSSPESQVCMQLIGMPAEVECE